MLQLLAGWALRGTQAGKETRTEDVGSGVTKGPADPAVRGRHLRGAISSFECGTILYT